MGTDVYLARILEEDLGLPHLAEKARRGLYNPFNHGLEDPLLLLIRDLCKAEMAIPHISSTEHRRRKIHVVINAARQGEFDGTDEEYRQHKYLYTTERRTYGSSRTAAVA